MKLRSSLLVSTIALSTFTLASSAIAAGDIVYSARYYAAPGSHETSHAHLYRISDDGSGRTQLTTGAHDDSVIGWSPNGKSILFLRDDKALCIVDEFGGKPRTLVTIPDSSDLAPWAAKWWPDSKAVIIPCRDNGMQGEVISASTGKVLSSFKDVQWLSASPEGDRAYVHDGNGGAVATLSADHKLSILRSLTVHAKAAEWIGGEAIVGLIDGEGDTSDTLQGFDDNGSKLWTRVVDVKHSAGDDLGSVFRNVTTIPGDLRTVILGEDISDSTIRPNYNFWQANVDTGKASVWLSEKQFITFKPNSRSYLTSPAKVLVNFGKPKGGHQRQVYVCGLEVGKAPSDTRPKAIVTGLVFVDGADWR